MRVIAAMHPRHGFSFESLRLNQRLETLRRTGGGTFVAPPNLDVCESIPGVRVIIPEVPVGANVEAVAELHSQLLRRFLAQNRVSVVHCFGIRSAVGALMSRHPPKVVVEPGVLPSVRLRDMEARVDKERLVDLVELEEKVLNRVDAVVARTQSEAAALAFRGVDSERIWLVPDGVRPDVWSPVPDLPHLATMVTRDELADLRLLGDACLRLSSPWRLTIYHDNSPTVRRALADIQTGRLGHRCQLEVFGEDLRIRLEGVQAFVSTPKDGRSLSTGGWLPDAVPWGFMAGRPVICPDVSCIRAYAGGAAQYYEAGNPGALAASIDRVLESEPWRLELTERMADQIRRLSWEQGDRLVSDLWDILECGHRGTEI